MSVKKRNMKHGYAEGSGANNQMPDRYPLVSDYQMDEGIAMVSGRTGQFSPNGDNIESLAGVLANMAGKTDDRSSVPSVLSQVYTFSTTMREFANMRESHDTVKQWRGCMALLLLYPLLFPASERPVWKNVELAEHDNNPFLAQMNASLPPKALPDGIRALCLRIKHKFFPLLQMNYECLALPPAFGMEIEYCPVPWLQPINRYSKDGKLIGHLTDPIPELSCKALQMLKVSMEQLFREQHCSDVLEASNQFITDLETAIEIVKTDSTVEQTLIKGLLLRNALDLDIHVIKYEKAQVDRMSIGDLTTPHGDRYFKIHEIISELEKEAQYTVLLGEKVVAYLNETDLLWCPTPKYVAEQPEYNKLARTLISYLERQDEGKQLTRLLSYQISRLSKAKWHCPAVKALREKYPPLEDGKKSIDVVWNPKPVFKNEAALENTPFEAMRLLARIGSESDRLFADKMILFEQAKTHPPKEDDTHIWHIPTEGNKEYITLLPFGELGAKMREQYPQLQVQKSQLLSNLASLSIDIQLSFRDNVINYQAIKTYRQNVNLEIFTQERKALPSMALWPNIRSMPGEDNSWRIFYAFVFFGDIERAWEFSASVYDQFGQAVGVEQQTCRDELSKGERCRWQTFMLESRPSFTLLKHLGDTIGVVSFEDEKAEQLPNQTRELKLCFDYGTTATIGEIYDSDSKTPHRFNLYNHKMLKWFTNAVQGAVQSLERFIAPNFCWIDKDSNELTSSNTDKGAVLSLMRGFGPRQGMSMPDRPAKEMVLHLDGNIYTLKKAITPAELSQKNVRSGMKLELDDDENLRYVKTFMTQMLQFFFLICRIEGAKSIDVRYAAPLALADQIKNLEEFFESIVKELGLKTGFPDIEKPRLASESMAASAHFKELDVLNALNPNQGLIVLDIGGGTADYSFWIHKAEGKINDRAHLCCSNKLAGREMMVRVLYEMLTQRQDSLENFIMAVEDAAGLKSSSIISEWSENLRNIHSDTTNIMNVLTIYTDQLLMENPELLENLLANEKNCHRLVEVINFNIALLLWIARIIYVRQTRKFLPNKRIDTMTLCLAGNGCVYYYALPKERRDKLLKIVSLETPKQSKMVAGTDKATVSGNNELIVNVLPKNERYIKREVIRGLREKTIFAEPFKQGAEDGELNALEITEDFFRFMERYANEFPTDAASQEYELALSNPDIESNLRNRIRGIAGSITALNRGIAENISYVMNRINDR